MKIVYFIDHLRPDGTQFVLKQLVEGLSARRHEQVVLCLNDSWDAELVKHLESHNTEVRIIGKRALLTGPGWFSILKTLRANKFDVVVTLLLYSDIIGRTLGRLAGVPRLVSSIQNQNVGYTKWQRWLMRQTTRWVDVILLNSRYVKDFAMKEEGATEEKIVVIPNSICVEDYLCPVGHDDLCKDLNVPAGSTLIGMAARLNYQKGQDILVRSFAKIANADEYLLLAGVGEDESKLRSLAKSLNIEKKVLFLGYRRDLRKIIGAFDLYVQPSRYEGMPIAVLEAMAAGCPVVASAVDGNQELIQDGVHGWLVPPEDEDTLASAMREAIENRPEARCRAKAAQRRVAEQFGVENMVLAWDTVLQGKPL